MVCYTHASLIKHLEVKNGCNPTLQISRLSLRVAPCPKAPSWLRGELVLEPRVPGDLALCQEPDHFQQDALPCLVLQTQRGTKYILSSAAPRNPQP